MLTWLSKLRDMKLKENLLISDISLKTKEDLRKSQKLVT